MTKQVRVWIAGVVLGSAVSAGSELRKPWHDVGRVEAAGAESFRLSVAGIPSFGERVTIRIEGGAPGAIASVHAGKPALRAFEGVTLVPGAGDVISVQLDELGAAVREIGGEDLAAHGPELALQSTLRSGPNGPWVSNAWVASALSISEGAAYSAAVQAAESWGELSVLGVRDLWTVADADDAYALSLLMANAGAMAQVDFVEGVPANLGFGTPSMSFVPPEQLEAYRVGIENELELGSSVVEVEWALEGLGSFTSYTRVIAASAEFDTFASSLVVPPPVEGAAGFPAEWGIEIKNLYGITVVSMSVDVALQCSGQGVSVCSAEFTESALPLWDGEAGTICRQTGGDCCTCQVEMGYVSGFKSISVGADGYSLSVTGPLGCSGTFQRTLQECCE